ncbi:MAG: cohesin domain-containing protein [Caldilineales bacterium]
MNPRFSRFKHLLFLFALLSLLATVGGNYHAAAAPLAAAVRVIGPASPIVTGQPFVVTIIADEVTDLGAFEFEYRFNADIATTTVNAIELGALLGSTGRTTGVLRLASAPGQPGVPLFGAYSYGEAAGAAGNGVLATVTMTANAPGTSTLRLTELKITDRSGSVLASTAVAGSVTVIAPTVTRPIYLPLLRRNAP